MQKTFWSFDDNVKSSVITEKDNTTNDKFAYSQIKQDGLEFQILGTIWLLDFPDLTCLIPMQPPLLICQYDGTINDCHTSGRFDPPFSWEMPVPSREYDSCFLVSDLVMS